MVILTLCEIKNKTKPEITMKTRQRTRKSTQKRCACDCDAVKSNVTIKKSPQRKIEKSRNLRKVNGKSSTTNLKQPNKNVDEHIKKQIQNNKNNVTISPVVILKKSLSPMKTTNRNNGEKTQPYVVLKQLGIKSSAMELRRNRQKNYCEPPSLNDESINEESIEKPVDRMPIYKQQIQDTTKKKNNKNNDDLYEFDSDSEEIKHKKHKQRKLNNSSHDEYNKTIENILRNVAAKIKERKLSPQKKTNNKNSNNNQKYIKSSTQSNKKVQRNRTKNITNSNGEQYSNKHTVNTRNVKNDTGIATTSSKHSPTTNNIQQIENKDSFLPSSKLVLNYPENNTIENGPNSLTNYDNHDGTFGFLDDIEELTEQPNKTPKVHVISNVKLKPNQQLIFARNTTNLSPIVRPNANSTIINNVLTPWRFNEINIRRNPHLIQVKHSALPSMTQEPVMEYSIIARLMNSSTPQHRNDNDDTDENVMNPIKQTPISRKSPRKYTTPSIQKTLDDYYGENNANKENRRVTRHSLFDIDDLSPIKIIENNRISPIKQINSIKRQILGNLNDNIIENIQISTTNLNKTENDELSLTYFGFETTHESDNSNVDNDKAKDDRPYRLSINVHDKKYEVKRKPTRIDEDAKDSEDLPDRIISDDDQDDDDGSDLESLGGAGLFEDFHETKETRENKLKKKRKVRWLQADDKQPKKRRKDVRTKKEEKEAEQWAEQFNSMCKEVDDFPLEIE